MSKKIRALLFGAPKDVQSEHTFHSSRSSRCSPGSGSAPTGCRRRRTAPRRRSASSSRRHDYSSLAVGLALGTALTVFIISYAYSRIIEHFPSGGGGYVVATKLLGPRFGVVSGCALLVDYVLTITVSIASGGDAIFSMIPRAWFGRGALRLAGRDRHLVGSGAAHEARRRVRGDRLPHDPQHPRRQGVGAGDPPDLHDLRRDARGAARRRDLRQRRRGRHGRPRDDASTSAHTITSLGDASARSCSSCAPTRSAAARTPASRPSRTACQIMREPKVQTAKRTMVSWPPRSRSPPAASSSLPARPRDARPRTRR